MVATTMPIRLPDVAEHVVPHLVPHHDHQLRPIERLEDRVPQHDALGGAESVHVGIDRLGVVALRHFEHAAAFDARPVGELRESAASSALSFIGPKRLKSGSIQSGVIS